MKLSSFRSSLLVVFALVAVAAFSPAVLADDSDETQINITVTNPAVEWTGEFLDIDVNSASLEATYVTESTFTVWSTTRYNIEVDVSRNFNFAWARVLTNPLNPAIGNGTGLAIWRHAYGFDVAVRGESGNWSPLQAQSNNHWSGLLRAQTPTTFETDLSRDHDVAVVLVLREDSVDVGGESLPTSGGSSNQPRFGVFPSGNYTVDVTVTVTEAFI